MATQMQVGRSQSLRAIKDWNEVFIADSSSKEPYDSWENV